MAKQQIAPGVFIEMKGTTAHIEVDTTQDLGPSKSQKTTIVAKTGYAMLPNGQHLNMTVTKG